MKNLKVTAMILAAALSAGTLMACSSDKETNNTATTVESETVESETSESEESITTESSELTEEQDMDALTEAVLQNITVARVEKVGEDGILDLTLFELPEASEEAAELSESATTEEISATEEVEETTATENQAVEFDFASLDLSIFVETEQKETYLTEETEVVQLVKDGVQAEAALADIQEGDMLVMFADENEVINIVIYRNVMQEEAVTE